MSVMSTYFKMSPGPLRAFSRMSNEFAVNHESSVLRLICLIPREPEIHRVVNCKVPYQEEGNWSTEELEVPPRLH
jgi:hypothetical protein